MRTFRLLVRTPLASYRGGGDGDRSGSVLLAMASWSTVANFSFALFIFFFFWGEFSGTAVEVSQRAGREVSEGIGKSSSAYQQ